MKKYLIISLTFGFIFTSCQKSDFVQAVHDATIATASASPTIPYSPCALYRIYNQYGPMGSTLMYEYTDCNGFDHRDYVEPMQMITITARPGTVFCSGGSVIPH